MNHIHLNVFAVEAPLRKRSMAKDTPLPTRRPVSTAADILITSGKVWESDSGLGASASSVKYPRQSSTFLYSNISSYRISSNCGPHHSNHCLSSSGFGDS